ncbi:hypothetical protein [uncultured Corynebacterium sp.]|uniref:hypothetical protein n=1 Tax=uncultured Corynebacterium sp. TaxID=159447 RepID=UPI0025961874|nr:hypothetical protein [uncultured Corynebacterium sp.]
MTDALFTPTIKAKNLTPGTHIAGHQCTQCHSATTWECTDSRPGKPPYTEGKQLLILEICRGNKRCHECMHGHAGSYDPEQEFPLP